MNIEKVHFPKTEEALAPLREEYGVPTNERLLERLRRLALEMGELARTIMSLGLESPVLN